MPPTDLQSDDFLALLSDALRAGPGSPEWRQAVSTLREHEGSPAANDYQLLITARERLESGRPYREIRPGPGFTRKVMERVDQYQPSTGRWSPITGWIAVLAVGVIIAVVVLLGQSGGTDDDQNNGLQALGQTYFVNPMRVTDFEQPLAPEWQPIGAAPVITSNWGLRLKSGDGESADYTGGGIAAAVPLAAQQPFAVEVQIRGRTLSDDLIPQLFITDTPDFAPELGTSPHELAWLIKSGRCTVALPDGRFEGVGDTILKDLREPMTVRIVVNDRFAIVECAGQRLWAGEHQLDPAKPRHVGLRFLRRGSNRQDHLAFQSFKLLLPQASP